MQRTSPRFLTFIAIAALAACGRDAEDAPATVETPQPTTNVPKPVPEAPTLEALIALDRQANEAYARGDAAFFEDLLSDQFVMREAGQRLGKADTVKLIAGVRCDVVTWSLDDPWMARIDPDTYVTSYRATWDGTCTGPDGKATPIPSPVRAATIWVRAGDRWQAAFHGENPIIDPKQAQESQPALPAGTAGTAAAAPADPNTTNALVAIEKAVWEAWKANDAAELTRLTADDLSFIDIFGNDYSNKADTIEAWSGAICDVTSVDVTDGIATALSPTVALLVHKGTTDGTCHGESVPAIDGHSVYVREGDTWKLAFTMNMLAR